MEEKTITISYEDFKNTAIEAIAEMEEATKDIQLGIIATILCVDIGHRLFEQDELTIDEKEGE